MSQRRALADFGDFVLHAGDLAEVLTEGCRSAGQAVEARRIELLELPNSARELLLRADLGWSDDEVGRLRLPIRVGSSVSCSMIEGVAVASVPIVLPGGRRFGLLQVDSTETREFDVEDLDSLRSFAAMLGVAIDRLHMAQDSSALEARRIADIAAVEELQRVGAELVADRHALPLYQRIVGTAARLMQADGASIHGLDMDTGRLELLAWQGLDPESVETWPRILDDGDAALRTGRPFIVPANPSVDEFDDKIDGRPRARSVQPAPLRTSSGRVVGMLSVRWTGRREPSAPSNSFLDVLARLAADMIERLHAGEQLRESEDRLRQFGEASQDVLWLRDSDTLQWSYLTPAFETIYGLSRQRALAGDNYRTWLGLVLPEDRAIVEQAIERVRRGERVTFDYRIRRPADGSVRWLRDVDFPISDASGEIRAVGGVGRDLTELREAELRLQTLVEGIPQLVWRAVAGEWTWASPQWTAFTGQPAEASRGWGWLDPLHPDDRDVALQAWIKAGQTGALEAEYRLHKAGAGVYRWFRTRATPVRDEDGAIVEWLGTSTDIDDLRGLQARQQVLVAELQHRTFNLMGMVRSMADETVRSSRNLQEFEPKFRDRMDALARVQRLLSRLNSGERICLGDLIRSELSAVGALDDDDTRISLEGPPGVELASSTVQTLAIAIHELTTNAVKYGALRQAGAHLYIGWRLEPARDSGRAWLHLDWRESGVKLSPAGAATVSTGQGRTLIEEALPYQLDAKTTYVIAEDGVKCSISLPTSEVH